MLPSLTRSQFCVAFAVVIMTTGLAGCSKSPEMASREATSAGASSAQSDAAGAEQVVGQFLDRIRRGGETNTAESLLTDLARAELRRIGKPIQPLGSPDANFEITRSEVAPEAEGANGSMLPSRLVHCIWNEPNPVATVDPAAPPTMQTQVVWAVVRQSEGWRISGLVMEMSPNEPWLVLDFENGELMAQMLAGEPEDEVAGRNEDADATKR